jgi:hypothetical protein
MKSMPTAILPDIGSYEQWRSALTMLRIVAQGEADIAAGRVISQDEAFRRAEQLLVDRRE